MTRRRAGEAGRLVQATRNSLRGLRDAWEEPAFRLEAWLAVILLPAAALLGRTWVERVLLAAPVLLALLVELLNTAIESAVDRVGLERHPLARRAKDVASAAVAVSLVLVGATWGAFALSLAGVLP